MELGTEWKNWGSEILKRGRPDGLEETAGGNAEARGAEGSQGPERTRPSHRGTHVAKGRTVAGRWT